MWTLEHAKWEVSQWENVVWSKECPIELGLVWFGFILTLKRA
jgi:hypothetical protein